MNWNAGRLHEDEVESKIVVMQHSSASITGAWRLVTFEFRKSDGSVIHPFGKQAQGTIIYTDNGRYSAQLMRSDRPRFAVGDQMRGSPEEMEANFKGCISYFGAYELNREEGQIVHHVEGSLFPNMQGVDQVRAFELTGNRLKLQTQSISFDGEKAVGVLIWERID